MDSETSKVARPGLPPVTPARALAYGEAGPREASDHRHAIIRSEAAGVELNLGELWRYRELLYFLTLRDIKVRYKQTLMGVAWVIIQPLLTVLIFTLVFKRFVRLDTGSLPYPFFALSGLLLWLFFANAVTNSTNSFLNNANLITKVYFPRMFIPAASVAAGLVDLGVAFLLLIALGAYYGIALTWHLLLLPLFVLLIALLALGLGLLAAASTVKYRDLRHALPFIIQLWLFASPVIYPSSIVPQNWRWLVIINPIAGIIEGFRASITGQPFAWAQILVSGAITLATLVAAAYIFRRLEDTFADVV